MWSCCVMGICTKCAGYPPLSEYMLMALKRMQGDVVLVGRGWAGLGTWRGVARGGESWTREVFLYSG